MTLTGKADMPCLPPIEEPVGICDPYGLILAKSLLSKFRCFISVFCNFLSFPGSTPYTHAPRYALSPIMRAKERILGAHLGSKSNFIIISQTPIPVTTLVYFRGLLRFVGLKRWIMRV